MGSRGLIRFEGRFPQVSKITPAPAPPRLDGPTESRPLLSICIPSYNRPEQLDRLLRSVDGPSDKIEIVICEDKAPRREEVRRTVEGFIRNSDYPVRYHENEKNCGYDRNLRELIQRAGGRFVMFMGDDDEFTPGMLSPFMELLGREPDLGYVLRTYQVRHADGEWELFKYFPQSMRFEKGPESYVKLFRRSVSISGFTFRRELAAPYLSDRFDGTLLYQLYLMAEIVLRHPSAYCDLPVVSVTQSYRLDNTSFGSAQSERGLYEPGKVTLRNSVNFMKGYFTVTEYMDRAYGLNSTDAIRTEISKYSYPILSIQRKRGVVEFLRYVRLLDREVRINTTPYYYLYAAALVVFNETLCDKMIIRLKRMLGNTPAL